MTLYNLYLEGGHPGAGGDEGLVRRQHADDLLDEEALAGARPARDEHVLAALHTLQHPPASHHHQY